MTPSKTTPEPSGLVDLYLRLSIDREGKDSIERQRADLREWARREGLLVRREWVDNGISGYKRNAKRPDFDAAVSAVTTGEVRTLAVWKIDRLSRRGAGQVGQLLDDIDAAGGRLFFLKDGIDTSTGGHNRLAIVFLSEQARAESANTSLRVRAKKEASRKLGEYLGGVAPFGYVVGPDRKLRQHPEEAPLIREVVDRVMAGETLLAVCRDWNARGIPTRRRGSHWRSSTLSAALRSPALAGLMPERRIDEASGKWSTSTAPWRHPDSGEPVSLMADGHASIVTEGERVRLLGVMDSRLRHYGRGKQAVRQPTSLLGGLIYCAACKRPANSFGGSYRCRRWDHDGTECPRPLSVSLATIDPVIRRAWAHGLAALEPGDPILDVVADHWLQKFDPAPLAERRDLLSQLEDAKARLGAADNDFYVRGTLDDERHARVTRGLGDRIAALSARVRELPQPHAEISALLDPELSLPAIEAATVPEARVLLRLAIDRIEVSPASGRGVRFVPRERVRIRWVGDAAESA
jgi:site-specific DNA recombinase